MLMVLIHIRITHYILQEVDLLLQKEILLHLLKYDQVANELYSAVLLTAHQMVLLLIPQCPLIIQLYPIQIVLLLIHSFAFLHTLFFFILLCISFQTYYNLLFLFILFSTLSIHTPNP